MYVSGLSVPVAVSHQPPHLVLADPRCKQCPVALPLVASFRFCYQSINRIRSFNFQPGKLFVNTSAGLTVLAMCDIATILAACASRTR
jgi:hypothetical protein